MFETWNPTLLSCLCVCVVCERECVCCSIGHSQFRKTLIKLLLQASSTSCSKELYKNKEKIDLKRLVLYGSNLEWCSKLIEGSKEVEPLRAGKRKSHWFSSSKARDISLFLFLLFDANRSSRSCNLPQANNNRLVVTQLIIKHHNALDKKANNLHNLPSRSFHPRAGVCRAIERVCAPWKWLGDYHGSS